jgi:hypothetical protein
MMGWFASMSEKLVVTSIIAFMETIHIIRFFSLMTRKKEKFKEALKGQYFCRDTGLEGTMIFFSEVKCHVVVVITHALFSVHGLNIVRETGYIQMEFFYSFPISYRQMLGLCCRIGLI